MKPAKYKAKDLKGKWVYGTPIETRPSLNNDAIRKLNLTVIRNKYD